VAKSFSLAGVTFSNVPVTIPQVTSGFFATRGVAGNLGSGILSRFTLVFDYRAQTVTFIPNRDVDRTFLTDRTGLSLNQSGASSFEVNHVVPNSPAAQAGIVKGDRIVAFNTKLVKRGYGLGDFAPLLVGTRPFTLTIERNAATTTVHVTPHAMITTAQ
jgi:S1-C subfamily serine protease